MISAATSRSRIAIHARPTRVRTRFFANTVSTTTVPRQRRYLRGPVSIGTPRSTIGGTSIVAYTPPPIQRTWVMPHSTMYWTARVVTAR